MIRSKVSTFMLVLALVILGSGVWASVNQRTLQRDQVEARMYGSLIDLAQDQIAAIVKDIDAHFSTLSAWANGERDDFSSTRLQRQTVLNVLRESAGFVDVGYINADGSDHWTDIAHSDTLHLPYVARALAGTPSVDWVNENDADYLAFAVPVVEDDVVSAVAIAKCPAEQYARLLSSNAMKGQSYHSIVDANGTLLVRAQTTAITPMSGNAIEFYREVSLRDGTTFDQFQSDIHSGAQGVVSYQYGNQFRYVAYAPVGINDWMMFSVYSQNPADPGATGDGMAFVLVCGQILLVALILVMALWLGNTSLRQAHALLRLKKSKRALFDISDTILFEISLPDGNVTYNAAFEREIGRKSRLTNIEQIMDPQSEFATERYAPLHRLYEGIKRGVAQSSAISSMAHVDGIDTLYRIAYNFVTDVRSGSAYSIVGNVVDVEKEYHTAMLEDTETDRETGFMSDGAFMREAQQVIEARNANGCALLLIDIDEFRSALAQYGRDGIKRLIEHLAERVRKIAQPEDLLARLSTDVFALLMTNNPSHDEIKRTARALCDVFIDVEGIPSATQLTCSVGVSELNAAVPTLHALYKGADMALHRAKLAGKHRFELYDGNASNVPASGLSMRKGADMTSVLLRCMTALLTEGTFLESMDVVLSELAGYYQADYVYVIQFDREHKTFCETYSWHRHDLPIHQRYQKRYDVQSASWLEKSLRDHKSALFTADMVDNLSDVQRRELQDLNAQSIYLVPLGREGSNAGFIAIENARDHVGSVALLKALTGCVHVQLARNDASAHASKELASDLPPELSSMTEEDESHEKE